MGAHPALSNSQAAHCRTKLLGLSKRQATKSSCTRCPQMNIEWPVNFSDLWGPSNGCTNQQQMIFYHSWILLREKLGVLSLHAHIRSLLSFSTHWLPFCFYIYYPFASRILHFFILFPFSGSSFFLAITFPFDGKSFIFPRLFDLTQYFYT